MDPKESRCAVRISLRVTDDEKQSLAKAAASAGTTLSNFVRHYALCAAREELAGRIITLSPEAHERFRNALDAPSKFVPRLRELFDLYSETRRMPGPVEKFEGALERAFGQRLRADDKIGSELWSALANVPWRHEDGEDVRYTFRAASEAVCFLIGRGHYDDWYMSGPAGEIAEWIREALAKEGWINSDP